MFRTSRDYRESLRRYAPAVYVAGRRIESVADEPLLAPGIAAVGVTYDYALRAELRPVMVARETTNGAETNRMLAVHATTTDLLWKLEAVRTLCQETGCALRYLTGDGLNALFQSTHRIDAECGTDYHPRLVDYVHRVQGEDLTVGIAMTDAKGDRSLRPHEQPNPDSYVHVVGRRRDGIVLSGTKAIVTGAPYVHEFLVLPGRRMVEEDADFAVACAVPVDAEGITIVARPAGRPGEAGAAMSARYGQSTGVVHFRDVFVPHERVFLCGEWEHAEFLTRAYANHHRHSCIGARAGFGDLLIGAGALMCDSHGLDLAETDHLRETMVELIKIVEGFYACGVAASTFGVADPAGNVMPEPVYANVGKLLLATHIYDMQRLAHTVAGGLVVTLPTPEEDHNPETAPDLAAVLAGRPDVPFAKRRAVARLLEDVTASYAGGWFSVISLHGGGSPEAMRKEIFRSYPIPERKALVERLLDRGLLAEEGRRVAATVQPGRCCETGCAAPEVPAASAEGAEVRAFVPRAGSLRGRKGGAVRKRGAKARRGRGRDKGR